MRWLEKKCKPSKFPTDECGGHLEAPGRNVTDGSLDVVGDPFNEEARVLVLNAVHLIVNLPHRHPATEDGGNSQVATVSEEIGFITYYLNYNMSKYVLSGKGDLQQEKSL